MPTAAQNKAAFRKIQRNLGVKPRKVRRAKPKPTGYESNDYVKFKPQPKPARPKPAVVRSGDTPATRPPSKNPSRGVSPEKLLKGVKRRERAAKRPAKGAAAARRIEQAQSRERSKAETYKLIREAQERAKPEEKDGILERTFKAIYPTHGGKGGKVNLATARGSSVPTAAGSIPGLAAKNTGISIASDPIGQGKRLPGDVAKSVIAIPAGLYGLAKDPKAGGKAIVKDYSDRYGPLTEGPGGERKFRERQKKDGVLPEVLDASVVGGAAGATVGRVAQAAARAGNLGKKLERVAVEKRPDVQVSAGKTRPQAKSSNLFTNVRETRKDTRSKKAVVRRLERHDGGAKDLVDVEAAKAGTVRPRLKVRRNQVDRRDSARLNAQSRTTMKGELNRTSGEVERSIRKTLGKQEQRGLTYAVKFGIRTPEQARRVLTKYATQIKRERAAAEAEGKPISLTSKTDQLPEIEALIRDADKVFTPNTARVADEYGTVQRKAAAKDPALKGEESRRVRAVKPLAEAHGVRFDEGNSPAAIKAHPAYKETARTYAVARRKLKDAEAAAAAKPTKAASAAVEKARVSVVTSRAAFTAVKADLRKNLPAEDNAAYLARAKAAVPEDLAEPAYFKGEKRNDTPFGAFTRGSGKKAKPKDKHYKGSLSRTGREGADPNVLVKSIAGSISRRYNWQFVKDNIRDGSPEWARNKNRSDLIDEAERKGIDPTSYVLIKHQIIDRDAELGGKLADDVTPEGDAGLQQSIHGALREASMPGDKAVALAKTGELDLNYNSGWTLMSKARYNELEAGAVPGGVGARGFDVAKGKVSRTLLGTPGWLQFQVASNGLMSGLAGTGPVDFAKAQKWWKALPEDQKQAFEPLVGISPWFDEQTRLGATANNKMVNGWRALKETGFYNHALNPTTVPRRTLDVLFRSDNAQNNAFRKAVLYSQIKRDAYARMGASSRNIIRSQGSVVPNLDAFAQRIKHAGDLGPQEAMRAVAKDAPAMLKHAEYVNDFLGDWTTYTAFERRKLGRSLMFYGFLRFSLKLTFYTMPVRHPILSTIMTQLGRLQTDELERIFGTQPPPWELANWYSEDGKQRVNIGRMMPFLNATNYFNFDTGAPTIGNAAYASLPPYMQVLGNAAFGRNVARDMPPSLNDQEYVNGKPKVGAWDLGKVAVAESVNTLPAARLLSKTGIPGVREPDRGKQTSASNLLNPDPRRYKQRDAVAANEQRKISDESENPLKDFAAPLLGGDGGSKVAQAQQRAIKAGKPVRVRRVGPAPRKPRMDPEIERAVKEAQALANDPAVQAQIRQAIRDAKAR